MIDLNKGVVYKMVPESRIRVYMYAQQPGVYLDAFGNQLSEVFAKEAGFDTDTLRTERTRQTRMSRRRTMGCEPGAPAGRPAP